MTTKEKINKGFAELRKAGYFAKQKWLCCQSCGWAAVPEGNDKVVFYHDQDADAVNKDGSLNSPLYLAWMGNADEIISIMGSCGLNMDWDRSDDSRIRVLPDGYIG